MKLILKTALRFAGLFVGFNLLLCLPVFENTKYSSSWWEDNYVKIQDYLYRPGAVDVVFAGSSLSANLPPDAFTPSVRNLGLVGYSSLTALECIRRSGRLPRAIVIETNWLERPCDPVVVAANFEPMLRAARKEFPGLREANQPVNVAAMLIDRFCVHLDPRQVWQTSRVDPDFFRLRLKQSIDEFNRPVDTNALAASVGQAGKLVSQFRALGVNVFLMEMPVDPALARSLKYDDIRSAISRQIDGTKYRWIPSYPHPESLETSDGNHLTLESLRKYAAFLNRYLTSALPR